MSRSIISRAIAALAVFVCAAALGPIACATSVTPPGPSAGGAGGESATSTSTTGGTGGAGSCTHKEDCAALSDTCNDGSCVNGACVKAPTNQGAACDDGKFCTVSDSCQSGVCTGLPKSCLSTGPCNLGVCDPVTDACTVEPANEGLTCIDSDPCTGTAYCQSGQCVGLDPVDCSFFDDACTIGVCDPNLGCVPQSVNDGFPCNDGLFCTIQDACQNGGCVGVPNPCVPNGSSICMVGSCSELNQKCTAVPGNNGVACDDKNPCTAGEVCGNGLCVGGAPVNAGLPCDDKNTCTPSSACDANGVCAGMSPILQCVAGDGCCPAGCDGLSDADCVPIELLVNGDFGTNDLTGWTVANNPNGGYDVVATFDVLSQVVENVPSSGPSARVLFQDFVVPAQFSIAATFSMTFYQSPSEDLDPQNVPIIEKDPLDQNADGKNQNAFRVDIVDPALDQFDAPVLFALYAPLNAVGAFNALAPVVVNDPTLLAFLQANGGKTLRLRIGQVESTFPWMLQLDDVSLKVQ